MPSMTGWFDPSQKGGALRLAANSYLPAKGDPLVRLPGLRRGDLIVLDNGRVTMVNGEPAGQLDGRPDFANLGAVHPNRPLTLETANASSPRTAETQRVVDLICPFGFGQRAPITSPPHAGQTINTPWPNPKCEIRTTTRCLPAVAAPLHTPLPHD